MPTDVNLPTYDPDTVHAEVRARYAAAAQTAAQRQDARPGEADCCGGTSAGSESFGQALYQAAERDELPDAAVLASLGCGNPTAVADLRDGEVVLDLGSGGGIDVLLSARRVGPEGKAYGLDMTEDMLALARRNATDAGAGNVEFLKGHIEDIPLPRSSVDVVISNCVINLAADKQAVFAEIARVLVPGGRIGISDIVAEDHLTPAQRAERGDFSGCIAGALSVTEYTTGLSRAGFENVSVTVTHAVADGMHSAIIQATVPAEAAGDTESVAAGDTESVAVVRPASVTSALPLASRAQGSATSSCC